MPFDVGDFPGASASDRATSRRSRWLVGVWLLTIAGMLLVMIGLGGLTRLTGSGLSIMEWAPLSGTFPPLSHQEWERLFALYKTIPQYSLLNADFQLADFQRIFWLEWVHRLWGRLIGVAFFLPLIWFWWRGHLSRNLVPRLLTLLLLGGLQGAVGWFMVASGFFPDATKVSAYRLVLHLALAAFLYGAILWTGLGLIRGPARAPRAARPVQAWALLTTLSVGLTIIAGGFVAGTHAGLTYNTFPLMDGSLVPGGYADLSPFLRNWTENIAAIQFNHRLLATVSCLAAVGTLVVGFRAPAEAVSRSALLILGLAVATQYALGIATLLTVVPADLAVLHQLGAFAVLTVSLVLLHLTRVPRLRAPAG